MLATLSLCLLAAQTANLTYTEPASSLGALVGRLSAKAGRPLVAHPDLAQEVVFLRVKGASLEEVKAKLASALHAEWIPTKDGDRIQRSPQHDKEIWNQHVALRRRLVDEALQTIRKELEAPFKAKELATGLLALKPLPDGNRDPVQGRQQWEAEQRLYALGPLNRLVRRLVLGSNPNDLAAIGLRERRIFKLRPTQIQKAIGATAYRSALSAYAREQSEWIDVGQSMNFAEDQRGRMVYDPRAQLKAPAKFGEDLALEVKRGEAAGLMYVNLIGERSEGFGRGVLTQLQLADPMRRFLNSEASANSKDQDLKLSPPSKLLLDQLPQMMSGSPEPAGPQLAQLILGIDKNEPHAWLTSDILGVLAIEEDKNVVAALSDQALMIALFGARSGPLRLSSLVAALESSGTLVRRATDGWIEFSPPDRYEAQIDFTPRAVAAKFLKSSYEEGRVDIRDLSRYAFESGRQYRGGIGEYFLMVLDRGLLNYSDGTDWRGLQMYGSLSQKEQLDFEKGRQLPYQGMTAAQKRIVDRMVYAGVITSDEMESRNSTRLNSPPVEPTQTFANGVPSGTYVVSVTNQIPTIVAYAKTKGGKTRALRAVNPWTLAHIELKYKGNDEMMKRYGVGGLAGYGVGSDKVVSIRVMLAPNLWKASHITIPEFGENVKPVPWDELPEPHRTQVAQSMEQLREQMKREAGGVPPPQR